MSVALRTVQRWARDGIDKPATAENVRRFLERRRTARIAPPPAGTSASDDRDDACYEAMAPAVTALMSAARDVGWQEAEAAVAVLSAVVDEMRVSAGDLATIATLKMAIAAVEEE